MRYKKIEEIVEMATIHLSDSRKTFIKFLLEQLESLTNKEIDELHSKWIEKGKK